MTFTVEVLLKETDRVISETVPLGERSPGQWTDEDVGSVLRTMLQAIARAKDPAVAEPEVALRGLSWIVQGGAEGVVIAIEIPSGAVVAGPFDIGQARLDAMVGRVIRGADGSSHLVH